MLVLVFALWLCRFTHYFGQWLFLNIFGIEVTKFAPFWVTFRLEFASDCTLGYLTGLLFAGGLFSLFMFIFFALIAFMCLKICKMFPTEGFRILACYGIANVVDPIITIIESILFGVIQDNWDGDPFKLSNYFEDFQESESYGPTMTALVYIFLAALSGFTLYNYLLLLHMNRRLIDNYSRLTASESYFYLPYDNEVSKRYLKWVLSKAHKYKSVNGATR